MNTIEFAKSADPDSDVFKNMAGSRSTITRRLVDLHGYLKRELRDAILPYFGATCWMSPQIKVLLKK